MDITGWIVMFVMLTANSVGFFYLKRPEPAFKYAAITTGLIAFGMTVTQVTYNLLN